MMMRRVVINGQSCIAGLTWSLTEKRSKAEIVSEADGFSDPYDRIIMLELQYGLARTHGKQAWRKTSSLAALLNRGNEASEISILSLVDADTSEPFWWVFGVQRGILSARADRCFTMKDEAEALALSLQDTLGIDTVRTLSPEESVARITEALAKLSRSEAQAVRLLPLHQLTRATVIKALAVIALLVAAGWGLHSYLEYRDRLVRIERSRVSAEQKQARIRDAQEHPERHFPRQWMAMPSPDAVIIQCTPAMLRHPLAANGWRLSSLSCSGTALAATWEHTDFSEYMLLPFNGVLDEQQPRLAVSHTPIRESLPKAERDLGSLLSREEATRRLYAFTQHFSLKTRLSWGKRTVKKVEKQDVACPWISSSWELSNLPAYLIADYRSLAQALNIPGLLIKEISYANESWKIRGELYAK